MQLYRMVRFVFLRRVDVRVDGFVGVDSKLHVIGNISSDYYYNILFTKNTIMALLASLQCFVVG